MNKISRWNYRPEIDGLRALAVIAVIINHFSDHLLRSGYLGVDIFFVISGYVITTSIASPKQVTLTDFLLDFYVRRIKRLAPALILFVLTVSFATIALNPIPRELLITGMTALFGVSNLYLLELSTNYFARSTALNSFSHTWSLGVEEQFYVVYPFCVWLCVSRSSGGVRTLFKVLLALSVASLISFVLLYRVDQPAAYFLMPTRFWELGAGAMVYFLRESARFNHLIERSPTTIVMVLIVLVLFAPMTAAVPATIAIVVLTGLLIAGLRPGTFAYALFSHRAVVYIGLISYSLYLWHWGVLAVSRWTIGVQWGTAPFQAALIYLLAVASYHFVESPLRRSDWSRWRLLSIGYGVSASVAACGLILVMSGPFGRRLGLAPTPPAYLQKTWWFNKEINKYIENCHVEYKFRSEYIGECLAGKDNNRRHVYLIGDSHARNYLPAVRDVFINYNYEVRYLTMGYGCAFLPKIMAEGGAKVHCQEYVQASYRYLTEHVRSGDVVFIGQALIDDKKRPSPVYFDFIKTFAKHIVARGAFVVLLDGTAPPKKLPEYCVSVLWPGCTIARAAVVRVYEAFDRLAFDAVREISQLLLCPFAHGPVSR